MKIISEVQIIPIKPNNGLVAFAGFVLYEAIYCSSVGVFTRPEGGYRLVYPTKKLGLKDINIFHPINGDIGRQIEQAVVTKLNEVMKND